MIIFKKLHRFKDGLKGDYSLRMNITGFWTQEHIRYREHLYAFYDHPEMMHDMNNFSWMSTLKSLE